jgi:hypothetical protein
LWFVTAQQSDPGERGGDAAAAAAFSAAGTRVMIFSSLPAGLQCRCA